MPNQVQLPAWPADIGRQCCFELAAGLVLELRARLKGLRVFFVASRLCCESVTGADARTRVGHRCSGQMREALGPKAWSMVLLRSLLLATAAVSTAQDRASGQPQLPGPLGKGVRPNVSVEAKSSASATVTAELCIIRVCWKGSVRRRSKLVSEPQRFQSFMRMRLRVRVHRGLCLSGDRSGPQLCHCACRSLLQLVFSGYCNL